MAKLILLMMLFSCATANKKLGVKLSVQMRNKLYDSQNKVEEYKNIDDQFFKVIKFEKCLLNWEEEVHKAKEALKRTTTAKQRSNYWFSLGNCYNYVGEHKLSFYYYDLVLGEEKKNLKRQSIIAYNMGQIYSQKGYGLLAESYFQQAVSLDKSNNLAHMELALRKLDLGEFKDSLRNLNTLGVNLPKSSMVNFLKGVNFFHLSDYNSVKNKVLSRLDERSIEKSLLKASMALANGKMTKESFEEFKELEVSFQPYKSFQMFLVKKYGNSFNGKAKI